MNYLETEIDEALEKLWIRNRKLNIDELKVLIYLFANFLRRWVRFSRPIENPDNLNVFYLKQRDIHLG